MKPTSPSARVAAGVRSQLLAPLLAVLLTVGAAALIFHFFQRQLAGASFVFGSHPEVLARLEASLDDLKTLAELDPVNRKAYRTRFDETEKTVHRLQILKHNRDQLVRRYQAILLLIFATSVVVTTGVYIVRQSRHGPRLARLQEALTALAEGRTDIELQDRGRDTIGRIATMIERTSRLMARDRRRLRALRNLSSWQEAARRHAHEMRTPLTSAQLELRRIEDLSQGEEEPGRAEIRRAAAEARQALDSLGDFTQKFTSFARLPRPELRRLDLARLLREFVATYATAWRNLELRLEGEDPLPAVVDRDMLRQVLVNLCDNSSLALGEASGRVTIRLHRSPGPGPELSGWAYVDVIDDGPGVARAVRPRLFEPYTTTRTVGQGMGLGLAISKKILLDHDGDLELVRTSETGTTFRLTLPQGEEE